MLRAQRLQYRVAWPTAGRIDASALEESARFAARALLLGVAYYVMAWFGVSLRFANTQIGVVWAPKAMLVAALVLSKPRHWLVLCAIGGIAHALAVHDSVPAWRWTWQILTTSGYAVTAAFLLRRTGMPLRFADRRQVSWFLVICVGCSIAFGVVTPSFVRSLVGLETVDWRGALLRTSLANGTALMLVAPVMLVWAHTGLRHVLALSRRRLIEAVAIMVIVAFAGGVAFSAEVLTPQAPTLLLCIIPPLLWAAVRFGPIGVTSALFTVGWLSLWGTAEQLGPFGHPAATDAILSLEFFWIILCPPLLLLAAAIREREVVEQALHEQRHQLAHVSRVATAGELSGALAHELRQPLLSIQANAETALHLMGNGGIDQAELKEILEDIVQQDRLAASVISRVQSLLRRDELEPQPLEMDGVVRDALALARSAITRAEAGVEVKIADGLPTVRGDRAQLLQVILNLVINGCESLHMAPLSRRRLGVVVDRSDESVRVVISDHGAGLPHGDETMVFEPFVTTKPDGLGLGLSIARSIVTAHGGRIWAENNRQGGATFHMLLPTAVESP